MIDNFFVYRRNLPHWRLKGSTYFVTWRLHGGQPPPEPDERTLIQAGLKHFMDARYKLYAYVVMDDHCHAVHQPLAEFSAQSILHSWKSFTAHELQPRFGSEGAG